MQDFPSISELAGKIFGGSGGGGAENRRLRGYSGGGGGGGGPDLPAKCPRCESTNTKFCYYNNYNLSQPRHFCKSCRRYWTKGGVLRNVPVGGGCRKSSSSKRSSSASSSKKSSKARRRPPAASRSSSDSSSLTATTPTDVPAAVSASFHDPSLFEPQTSNPNPNPSPDFDPAGPEPPPLVPVHEMFPESGTFTSLMAAAASAGPTFLGFNFSDPPPPLRIPPQQQKAAPVADEIRIPELTPDLIDATMPVDLPRMGGGGGGMNGLDWPGVVDPSFFDLTGTVDPGAYFSPANWCDADPSLYLP